MRTISSSHARKELTYIIEEVANSNTPVILTHKVGNVIMLSEEDYWNIVEHLHILKDEITIKALKNAIEDRKKGKGNYKSAEDLINELEI